MLDKKTLQFVELLKAGLWNKQLNLEMFRDDCDFQELAMMSLRQTVTGLIGVAFMQLPKGMVPRALQIALLKKVSDVEERNRRVNKSVAESFGWLLAQGLHPWLIKGQGVAQDYDDPLKRVSGDIDVFFADEKEYEFARRRMLRVLQPSELKADNRQTLNLEFMDGDVYMEFHGRVVAEINHRSNRHFAAFTKEAAQLPPRRWGNVTLPPVRFDAVFIFTHLVRHYFGGGIGLRQVCDWMRFMHSHAEEIDREQLRADLDWLGLMKIWQAFAAMAVEQLGCPRESLPFYEVGVEQRGEQILRYIMESGNFGYYDERTKSNSKVYIVRRFVAFWGHLQMKFRNFAAFPEESVYGIPSFLKDGMKRTFASKQAESLDENG